MNVLLFLFLILTAAAEVEIILKDAVISSKHICLEFVFRGLPLKADYDEVGYYVQIDHYVTRNLDDVRKHTLDFQSTDNCQDRASYASNQHWTHICTETSVAINSIAGMKGHFKFEAGNKEFRVSLPHALQVIDIREVRLIEKPVNHNLCRLEKCSGCRDSCAAIFHDRPHVLCNKKLTEVFAQWEPVRLAGGGVFYSEAEITCINLYGSPKRQFSFQAMFRGKPVDNLCQVNLDEVGQGFICLRASLKSVIEYPIDIVQVHMAEGDKKIDYHLKLPLQFDQTKSPSALFEVSDRIPRFHPNRSCNHIIEEDWYVPFKKKPLTPPSVMGVGLLSVIFVPVTVLVLYWRFHH